MKKALIFTFCFIIFFFMWQSLSAAATGQEVYIAKNKPRPMQPPHISAEWVDSNCSTARVRITWKRKNDTADKFQAEYSWVKKANPPFEKLGGQKAYSGQEKYSEVYVVPQKNRNGSDHLQVRIREIDANDDSIPSQVVNLKCKENPPDDEFVVICYITASSKYAPATLYLDASKSKIPAGKTVRDYEWQFPDGTVLYGIQQTRQLSEPGKYVIILTVYLKTGEFKSVKCECVTLKDPYKPEEPDCEVEFYGLTIKYVKYETETGDWKWRRVIDIDASNNTEGYWMLGYWVVGEEYEQTPDGKDIIPPVIMLNMKKTYDPDKEHHLRFVDYNVELGETKMFQAFWYCDRCPVPYPAFETTAPLYPPEPPKD